MLETFRRNLANLKESRGRVVREDWSLDGHDPAVDKVDDPSLACHNELLVLAVALTVHPVSAMGVKDHWLFEKPKEQKLVGD